MRIKILIIFLLIPIICFGQLVNYRGLTPAQLIPVKNDSTVLDSTFFNDIIATPIKAIIDRMDTVLYASDFTTINLALDTLMSRKGALYVPMGEYTYVASDSLTDSLMITGSGVTSLIECDSNATMFYLNAIDDLTFMNLSFRGTKGLLSKSFIVDSCSNVTFYNCAFDSFNIALQFSGECTNVSVVNCKFTNCNTEISDGSTELVTVINSGNEYNVFADRTKFQTVVYTDTLYEYTTDAGVVIGKKVGVDSIEARLGNYIHLLDTTKVNVILQRTGTTVTVESVVINGDTITAGRIISDTLVSDLVATNKALTDTVDSYLIIPDTIKNSGSSDLTVVLSGGDLEITTGSGDSLKRNGLKILDNGDIAGIKDPFWLGEDHFPLDQLVYRDTTFNNFDSNCVIVTALDTTSDTNPIITLNWLPYRTTLISPNAGQRWAILNCSTWNSQAGEPNRSGDAESIVAIDSANYTTKELYCWNPKGSPFGTAFSVGDTVMIYNPFGGSWEWSSEPLIEPSGIDNWRGLYVSPGAVYTVEGEPYLYMIVNATDLDTAGQVGAFKCHYDSLFYQSAWHALGDTALYDTSSVFPDGVICTSVIKSPNEDVYIGYTSGKNGEVWRNNHILFTAAPNFIYECTDNILSSPPVADEGQSQPSVVRYGGKYLMTFTNRDDGNSIDANDHDNWTNHEAWSYNPTGPFTVVADSIFPTHQANKFSFRSGYCDFMRTFLFKGRIYAIYSGTSIWHESGSKANRWWGMAYRNERDGTPTWIEDPRSPLWINVMQKQTSWDSYDPIWGTGQGNSNTYRYAVDHSGGYFAFFSNPNDGYIYVFVPSNSVADDYRIWAMRLNASLW